MYHVVWANLKKKIFVIETVESFEINSWTMTVLAKQFFQLETLSVRNLPCAPVIDASAVQQQGSKIKNMRTLGYTEAFTSW